MAGWSIARFVNPWGFKRAQREQRVAALRQRDGDKCTRCRRPIRFDLPAGHDFGAKVEEILPGAVRGAVALDNLCLTHGRCNANSGDDTIAVVERARRKGEAEPPADPRRKRRAA